MTRSGVLFINVNSVRKTTDFRIKLFFGDTKKILYLETIVQKEENTISKE